MPLTLERKRQRLIAAILREQKKALRKRIVGDQSGGGLVCLGRNPSQKVQRSRACEDMTLMYHRQNWPLPALIHAFLKTGLLITAETIDGAKPQDLKVWYAAVADYFAIERQAKVGSESRAYH